MSHFGKSFASLAVAAGLAVSPMEGSAADTSADTSKIDASVSTTATVPAEVVERCRADTYAALEGLRDAMAKAKGGVTPVRQKRYDEKYSGLVESCV